MSSIPPSQSIRAPQIDSTRSEQIQTAPLLARTAELRDQYASGADQARELHGDVQQLELDQITLALEHEDTPTLLERLAEAHGFAWATAARCLSVSPTALRKWRKGEEATPANHSKVARLLAFAELLQRLQPRIDDAAYWLEAPVVDESTLTRVDLYRRGTFAGLLDMASERQRPVDLLDETVPDWRRDYARDDRFDVTWHEDGSPSITLRGEDE
jgi:hypothetical protein